MLNELKLLSDSIGNIFPVENWDDKFKEIKTTSPCFVVALSAEGTISDIRKLDADKAKGLRTWQGGSLGSTFPAFNFHPFYTFVSVKGKGKGPSPKEKASAISDLVHLFVESSTLPTVETPLVLVDRCKADEKTVSCLKTVSRAFFTRVCANAENGDSLVHFHDVFNRFFPSESTAESFNSKILAYLRHCSHLESEAIIDILVNSGDVVLFLDIATPDIEHIASDRTMKTINGRLLATKGKLSSTSKETRNVTPIVAEIDAFGKDLSADVKMEKLPEVKLPGALANTKLRSMAKDKKCQTRYGLIDAESFPVGEEIRTKAKAALSWISSPDREGRTWAKAGLNELVFAYPKAMPKTPPLLARLFGNGRSSSNDGETEEARFEEYAKAALSGIKSLSQGPSPNTEIEVFAIKKADKARRKVVFYRNYSLAKLEAAVSAWLSGADNIPPILFRKWPPKEKGEKAPKGTKPVSCEFRAPLPLAATGLVYAMWSQDGNEKFEPKYRSASLYDGFPVFDGLELFLGESVATGLAERMLSLLLQGSGSLCAASGNLARKNEVLSNARAVAHLENTLPLFGILLHKLNHNKETYMENAPYLIGRFLNLADGLHAVWCRNVKDKDPLPPQLLGSSLFASFQLNPVQGFANAGMRMKPYIDWAKTNQTGDVALSRWFVGEFGRITTAIEKAGIPVRLSDADKAEMLLGYLSSAGKSAESDPSDAGIADVKNSL